MRKKKRRLEKRLTGWRWLPFKKKSAILTVGPQHRRKDAVPRFSDYRSNAPKVTPRTSSGSRTRAKRRKTRMLSSFLLVMNPRPGSAHPHGRDSAISNRGSPVIVFFAQPQRSGSRQSRLSCFPYRHLRSEFQNSGAVQEKYLVHSSVPWQLAKRGWYLHSCI